jgi:HPt (histidine-containing phosphotransfer) domain-containing protein
MTQPDPAPADPIQGPLQDLRRAIEALRPHLDTPDQRAELFVIEDALARLASPRARAMAGLGDFDPSRLSHLLEITGPSIGPELLARLIEDLTATQDQLDTGSATQDWKRLREGSHVLISLSGSVGALSLQAMSENLNAIAHRQDRDALDAQMPSLTGELVALIQLIRATRPPQETA